MSCPNCTHEDHRDKPCQVLMVYERPGGPPRNQRCLCGWPYTQQVSITSPQSRCINNCGPLYLRDDAWWCLNNDCEYSYFFELDKNNKVIPRSSSQIFGLGFVVGMLVMLIILAVEKSLHG